MAKNRQYLNESYVMATMDELVPSHHLVRDLQEFIDWDFIYPICDPLYSPFGTNRVDPVVLFKLMMINIIFGIHSMRKTC
jgi:transposase